MKEERPELCPKCLEALDKKRPQYLKDGKAVYYKCDNEKCKVSEVRIKLAP